MQPRNPIRNVGRGGLRGPLQGRFGGVSPTVVDQLFEAGDTGDMFDFTNTANANGGSISSGDPVTSWAGERGSLTFGAGVGAARPVYEVVSGQARVTGNGTNQDLVSPVVISAHPFVLAGVVKAGTTNDFINLFGTGFTQYAVVNNSAGTVRGAIHASGSTVGPTAQPAPTSTGYQYFEAAFTSSTITCRVGDGSPQTTAHSLTMYTSTGLVLFRRRATDLYGNGSLVHCLLRNRLFTDAERAIYKAEALSKVA